VKTKFNKSNGREEEEEENISNDAPHIFPNIGHCVGGHSGVMIQLDSHTWTLAHRYVLFNTEDEVLEGYIN